MAVSRTEVLNTVFASTHSEYDKNVYDTLFASLDFFNEFMGEGREGVMGETNGKDFRFAIGYQTSGTAKWLSSNMDTLDVQNIDPAAQGVAQWAAIADMIVVPDDEIRDNMGSKQIFDIVEVKTTSYVMEMQRRIEVAMMAATSTTEAGQCNSIFGEVSTTPTTGTIHGFDRAIFTTVQHQCDGSGGAAETNLLPLLRRMTIRQSRGQKKGRPTHILSSGNMFEAWWALTDVRHRITEEKNRVPLAMDFLDLKWIWADSFPTDTDILILNLSQGPECGVKVVVTQKTMEGGGKWIPTERQFASGKKLKCRFQIIFPVMQRNGRLANIVI
jgi:hypothetical protein